MGCQLGGFFVCACCIVRFRFRSGFLQSVKVDGTIHPFLFIRSLAQINDMLRLHSPRSGQVAHLGLQPTIVEVDNASARGCRRIPKVIHF